MTCLMCGGWGTVTNQTLTRRPGQAPASGGGTSPCPAACPASKAPSR